MADRLLNKDNCWACGRSKSELEKLGVGLIERTGNTQFGQPDLVSRDFTVCEICHQLCN